MSASAVSWSGGVGLRATMMLTRTTTTTMSTSRPRSVPPTSASSSGSRDRNSRAPPPHEKLFPRDADARADVHAAASGRFADGGGDAKGGLSLSLLRRRRRPRRHASFAVRPRRAGVGVGVGVGIGAGAGNGVKGSDVRAMAFNGSRDEDGNPLFSFDDYEFAPYMGLRAPREQRQAFDVVEWHADTLQRRCQVMLQRVDRSGVWTVSTTFVALVLSGLDSLYAFGSMARSALRV